MKKILIFTFVLSFILTGCGGNILNPQERSSAKVLEKCNYEISGVSADIMNKMHITNITEADLTRQLKVFRKIADSYNECMSDNGYSVDKTLQEYIKDGLNDYEKAYSAHLAGTYLLMTDNLKIPASAIVSAKVYSKEQVELFETVISMLKN
ncbi:hypothetical protein Dacet_2638 [Denitrovibrio acetiphilus DSM 12809]|jgi:hypothetical protein|uniref:Lipoprotein n=1 Tax=Denitrovibrio acetiphilus (strain DSM 12809 / NBRC 114555 / N2460) TaxID=522772 RepID=D4H540_DENA2|nr:hypothetical protein [Denitrovibrio acetiphilus]ADD69396.1 hypothetical protein Dacet_2638 [Denitrovibrio acetiphilus DSM 12809]